jgi:hypothetical protein
VHCDDGLDMRPQHAQHVRLKADSVRVLEARAVHEHLQNTFHVRGEAQRSGKLEENVGE